MGGPEARHRDDPVVANLLTIIRCGSEPMRLTGETAVELLASALGGLDALAIRRLRRSLRASATDAGSGSDLVAAVLSGSGRLDSVPADSQPGVRRVRSLLELSREHRADPSAEHLLWALWRRSGLESSLLHASERGGRSGQRADRTLDAVVALFDLASDVAARVPLGGLGAFLTGAEEQLVSGRGRGVPGGHLDAVTVLSAHAAKGLEWQVVVLAGVQEGSWPDLGLREDLLRTGELLDLTLGRPARMGERAAQLSQERRLFYVAATRARHALLCTAVHDEEHEPSRFLAELLGRSLPPVDPGDRAAVVRHPDGGGPDASSQPGAQPDHRWSADGARAGINRGGVGSVTRQLHLADLIADLRTAVSDAAGPPARREAAALHLARLAAAGVRGAAPEDWWGLAELSTTDDVVPPGSAVRLSPSSVEGLLTCPLRAVLERRGGSGPMGDAQVEGIAAHALAHGISLGLADEELSRHVDEFIDSAGQLPPWQRRRVRRVLEAMGQAARIWKADTHPPRRLVGSELAVDFVLPPPDGPSPAGSGDPGAPDRGGDAPPPGTSSGGGGSGGGEPRPVRVVGRVDWLSEAPDGSLVVTDFKTAAARPSQQAVRENPQLATYQVAVAAGAFRSATGGDVAEAGPAGDSGGAELVYLRGGVPKVLAQPSLTPEQRRDWLGRLHAAAEHLASGTLPAQQNERCERCPVRPCCPIHSDGTQVTR